MTIVWINCEGRKDIVLCHVHWSVENEGRRPFHSAISAARDKNIVEIRRLGFLETSLTCSIDVVDIVGERIGDYWPLVVVKGRVGGCATLTDDRIPDAMKGQAVIVGALDVD